MKIAETQSALKPSSNLLLILPKYYFQLYLANKPFTPINTVVIYSIFTFSYILYIIPRILAYIFSIFVNIFALPKFRPKQFSCITFMIRRQQLIEHIIALTFELFTRDQSIIHHSCVYKQRVRLKFYHALAVHVAKLRWKVS